MSNGLSRTELMRRHERRLKLMVPAEPRFLEGLSVFAGIPEKARGKVIEKVRKYTHFVEYSKGEVLLHEGDYGDSAYFIVRGSVEVMLIGLPLERTAPRPRVRGGAHVPAAQRPGARPEASGMVGRGSEVRPGEKVVLGEGEIFGEMSALSRYPVSATVRAATDVRLLQIRLQGLRMLTAASKEFKKFLDTRYRERTLARQLRNVSILSQLDDSLIESLKERVELLPFEPGQMIVEEGAPADGFFLVRGGFVKVSVRAGASDLAITYLRRGDYAGASALLLDEAWPFTLQALEHVELVKLGKEDFRQIVSQYPKVQEELWRETVARLKARGVVSRNPIASEYMQMAMETGLIHGESVLLIDLSTCTRCDECVRGCADAHGGEPRFIREGQKYRNWLVPTACYQCTDPVCMMDCPTGAITREVGTLEVTINEATCIGCTNCAQRCPWGNIIMVEREEKRPDGKPVEVATKCDLCLTRPQGPACVQMCPHGSAIRISFKDMERVTATLR